MALLSQPVRWDTGWREHIFLTLCEVSPGVICAGGYASGLYRIEKKTGRVEYFPPPLQQRGVQTSISMTSEKILEDVYGQGAATISNVSIPMTAQYACTRSRPHHRHTGEGSGMDVDRYRHGVVPA